MRAYTTASGECQIYSRAGLPLSGMCPSPLPTAFPTFLESPLVPFHACPKEIPHSPPSQPCSKHFPSFLTQSTLFLPALETSPGLQTSYWHPPPFHSPCPPLQPDLTLVSLPLIPAPTLPIPHLHLRPAARISPSMRTLPPWTWG